jgi:RNA polymerase sigma factor (TIGR02999 family)
MKAPVALVMGGSEDTPASAAPGRRPVRDFPGARMPRARSLTARWWKSTLAPMPNADDTSAGRESVAQLFPALYRDLRRLARSRLASGGRHTLLDTSALVHEAYLRMQRDGGVALNGREHFLAYAATTMRSVVIDFVRRRSADRRGGHVEHVTLDTRAAADLGAADEEILAVHEALEALAQVDATLVQLVEMRYFAGLSDNEVATALGVSERTVRRQWQSARLLLAELLGR